MGSSFVQIDATFARHEGRNDDAPSLGTDLVAWFATTFEPSAGGTSSPCGQASAGTGSTRTPWRTGRVTPLAFGEQAGTHRHGCNRLVGEQRQRSPHGERKAADKVGPVILLNGPISSSAPTGAPADKRQAMRWGEHKARSGKPTCTPPPPAMPPSWPQAGLRAREREH